jgi:hypothetical protein
MSFGDLATLTDASRWHMVFTLLSMDGVTGFWRQMGLEVKPNSTFLDSARTFVKLFRQCEGDQSLSDDVRLARYRGLYEETFKRIGTDLGRRYAQAVYDWGSEIFPYELNTDAGALMWRRILRRLAGIFGEAYPLVSLRLPDRSLDAVKGAVERHLGNLGDLQHRIAESEQGPLSSWDEHIYRTYTSGSSPLDWVENTVELVNTRLAWQEIEARLSSTEMEILRSWARNQAEVMEMPANMVDLLEWTRTSHCS